MWFGLSLLRGQNWELVLPHGVARSLRQAFGWSLTGIWNNATLIASIVVPIVFCLGEPAKSQQWPERPVRIIVPYAVGGSADTIARVLARRFSEVFAKSFYVENKAGANGIIAAETAAHSQPDGYTLFMAVTPQIAIAPAMIKVGYDPMKDFVPISAVITNTFALIVNRKIPVETVSDFVDYLRSQPAKLPYSSGGTGSVTHLAMELFLKRAGLQMTNVNYKGGAPALAAVVAGEIPARFSVLSDALPHEASHSVRILAVSGEKRSPQIPEVPTLIESGFPGYKVMSWIGLMAPAGTPKEIVDRISIEVVSAMKDPKLVKQVNDFGAEPLGNTPDEFKAMISADIALWGEAVEIAGVKLH
jgi:tripartite-type tricarboxylate transporter receptor subunit TctC